MPSKQIITVGPDGSLFGLLHKRGQGINILSLGHAKVERVTLIELCEERQAWFIKATKATHEGPICWTPAFIRASGVDPDTLEGRVFPKARGTLGDTVAYFSDYEDAVAAEVAVIQALQVAGRLAA